MSIYIIYITCLFMYFFLVALDEVFSVCSELGLLFMGATL